KETGDSIKRVIAKRDGLPGPKGKIRASAPGACPLDHIPAQVDPNSRSPVTEILFDKEAGAAAYIKKCAARGESIPHVHADARMVRPAAGMVVVEIVYICNIIVVLLDFLPSG